MSKGTKQGVVNESKEVTEPLLFSESQKSNYLPSAFEPNARESLKRLHRESVDPKNEVEQLLLQISARIRDYESSKNPPMVPYKKILLTLADRTDKIYLFFGFATAILCGLGLPSFVFLFGDIADSFEGNLPADQILSRITNVAKILTGIGLVVWLFSYCFFTFFIIASERIGQKTRCMYLQAIL